jgi:hypothetical protein
MAVVEITDVVMAPSPVPGLRRFELDAPRAGGTTDHYAVWFEGWVMTEGAPPAALEISRPEVFVDALPIGVPRPDLPAIFPDVEWAGTKSGFRSAVTSLRLPREFQLHVRVLLADGTRIPLATVHGRQRSMGLPEATLRPLMITTLGRSGSTWVQNLLAEHPEIVTYPAFKSDVRVASYWLEALLALSEPASYRQALGSLDASGDWWLGRPRRPNDYFPDDDAVRWLGREQVEALAVFCRGRIESFYEHLAEREGMRASRYFMEKRLPSVRRHVLPLREIFPGTREVFVVRDFRDMLCSILAFNEKLGVVGFGRDVADSDESYVSEQLATSVNGLAHAWRERAGWAHLLRYEDLVLEGPERLRSLLEFLELPTDDKTLEDMVSKSSQGADRERHMTADSARASIGRWKRDLSPSVLAACEESFGEALATFGYER